MTTAGWRRAAIAGLIVALFGCGRGGNPERTPVVVYSPHGRDLLGALERAYEAANPTVDIRWLDMGSQEVFDRVRSEKVNPQADVWFGGPDAIFARGAREGLLAPFVPTWAAAVAADARHPEGLYHGVYRTLPVLVWNAEAVPAAEAPRDWEDLLAPRWRGQVLMRDPLASGTLRTVFAMVLARSVAATGGTEPGFGWLRRLDAQTREYTANPTLLFEKLVRREGLVTVWELSDILLQRRRGVPLGFGLASSGTPVIDDAVALVHGAPHRQEARRYIEWVGSVEAQRLAAEQAFKLPARTDLDAATLPEWAREVLAALRPAELDWALIEERAAAWMAEWDRSVRGRGAS
jgi:iron(III) transport system substrate-binding protein